MKNELKKPDYGVKVVKSSRNETDDRTLYDAVSDFVTEFEDHDEIVMCEDGRCYQILPSFVIEEISKEEVADLTGWELAEVS